MRELRLIKCIGCQDEREDVTQLLPSAVPTGASGYTQHGYDMRLAALLAQVCGITAAELVQRTQEASNA